MPDSPTPTPPEPAPANDDELRLKCPGCGSELPISGVGAKALKFNCYKCRTVSYVYRSSGLLKGTRFAPKEG